MRTGALETQLSLDAALGRAAEWAERATHYLGYMAAGDLFTADDLRRWAGDPPGHGDALGAVLRNAAKAGLIRPVGFRTSTRPDAHGRVIREWERL